MPWIDALVFGLTLGGTYALVALGLNLQYGVARILNLAYGEMMIWAAFLALILFTRAGVSPLLGLLAVVPAMLAMTVWFRKASDRGYDAVRDRSARRGETLVAPVRPRAVAGGRVRRALASDLSSRPTADWPSIGECPAGRPSSGAPGLSPSLCGQRASPASGLQTRQRRTATTPTVPAPRSTRVG